MTNNTIKNHLLSTFRKYGFRPNNAQLERAVTRYQCFGPKLLTAYVPYLDNCYSRSDIWIFLEMACTDAISKTNYIDTLDEAMKKVPAELWIQSYEFYDAVGHDKFGTIEHLIDSYRKKIFSTDLRHDLKRSIMNNQLNKLLDDILLENKCKPNLRKQLLNHLTEETREYYDLLQKRIERGDTPAPVELKIMREKINNDMEKLKTTKGWNETKSC